MEPKRETCVRISGVLGWFCVLSGASIACGITLSRETVPELLGSDMVWRWGPHNQSAESRFVTHRLVGRGGKGA